MLFQIVVVGLALSQASAKVSSDTTSPQKSGDDLLFSDLLAIPSKIGRVCPNITAPYKDKASGIVLNATDCESLTCPAKYKCHDANDTNPLATYVVCCDHANTKQFADISDCPNDEDPLPSNNYPGPIWAKTCDSISSVCTSTNANYSCILPVSKSFAKCCRTDSWKIKTKKHCPFQKAYTQGGKEPTCGRFFLQKGDSEECPKGYKCIERESTSYCCVEPGPPNFLLLIADIFNETCLNASADFGTCAEQYFGIDTDQQGDVIQQLNISRFTDFSKNTADVGSVSKKIREARDSKLKARIANFSSTLNETELEELQTKVCTNYTLFKSCAATKLVPGCHLVAFLDKVTIAVLDSVCGKAGFKELYEAFTCLGQVVDQNEDAVDKCADEMGNELEDDLTFGFEYIFSSICPVVSNFFKCVSKQMPTVCKTNGAKHAKFIQKFMSDIYSAVFGSSCQD